MKKLTPLAAMVCALSFCTQAEAQQEKPFIVSGPLIEEAIKLHDAGKYKEAIALYRQIPKGDSNYVYGLYEQALSQHLDSQFVAAIRICEEALHLKTDRQREPDLYTQLAISIDNGGDQQRAIRVFDSGLAKYPSHIPLLVNKGITLAGLKQWDAAMKVYQQALLINPYHASAHLRLAQCAVQKGRLVEAYLGYVSYLIINPSGPHHGTAITGLSKIANVSEDVTRYIVSNNSNPESNNASFASNTSGAGNGATAKENTAALFSDDKQPENFKEVQEIVLSKIALNNNYKSLVKLNDVVCRQLQVICEKISYDKNDQDFWMQYYAPLFSTMLQDKRFEVFVNYIFSNLDIEQIQKYVKSHKKEIDKFKSELVVYLDQLKTTRVLDYTRRSSTTERFEYEDGGWGFGKVPGANDKTNIGPWVFNYHAGNKVAAGNYDATGKKDGNWKYYYFNGSLKGSDDMQAGVVTGTSSQYFENGNISETGPYINDQRTGLYTVNFLNGQPSRTMLFEKNLLNGRVKRFYSTGQLREEQDYANGKQEGIYKLYYKSGKLQAEYFYVNDLLDGPTTGYFENGKKNLEGSYKNNKAEGTWKRYHENGQLSYVENYVKGNNEGEYSQYYDNGQLQYKTIYKQGTVTGEVIHYDRDGKKWHVLTLDKNKLRSGVYFDKSGKEIGRSVLAGKTLDYTGYTAEGRKLLTRTYNDKSEINGIETNFFPSGDISVTTEYKDGQLNGTYKAFHTSGTVSYELHYVGGEKDGYYRSWYLNGQLKSEGWYKSDNQVGNWYYYDELGKLESKNYYVADENETSTESYYPNGTIKNIETRQRGWLVNAIEYDSLGTVLSEAALPTASGHWFLKHHRGKLSAEANIINGNFQGLKSVYYFDGSLASSTNYDKDELHGDLKTFFFGGKPMTTGSYKGGKKDGEWVYRLANGNVRCRETYVDGMVQGKQFYYHSNGKIETEFDYDKDMVQGWKKKYDEEGHLAYQVKFIDDLPVSYTYEGKDGKLVPEILITNGTASVATFYSNGKPSASYGYKNHRLHGKHQVYAFNGQMTSENTEIAGNDDGPATTWYTNGKMRSVTKNLVGKEHGNYKRFNEKGVLVEEGFKYLDAQHGKVKFYDDNGKLIKTHIYYYGDLMGVE